MKRTIVLFAAVLCIAACDREEAVEKKDDDKTEEKSEVKADDKTEEKSDVKAGDAKK